MDRKGENIIIYPAIVIMALGILLLSQAQNSVMLLSSAALLGFGFGNIQSVCQTIAVKSTTLQRMGLSNLDLLYCPGCRSWFWPLFPGYAAGPDWLSSALSVLGAAHPELPGLVLPSAWP